MSSLIKYAYSVELYLLKVSHVTHTELLYVPSKGHTIQPKQEKENNKQWGLIFLPHFIYMSKKCPPSGAHSSTQNTICFMHKGEHATGE